VAGRRRDRRHRRWPVAPRLPVSRAAGGLRTRRRRRWWRRCVAGYAGAALRCRRGRRAGQAGDAQLEGPSRRRCWWRTAARDYRRGARASGRWRRQRALAGTAVRGLPALPATRRTVAPCWVSRSAIWRVRASPIRRPHSRTANRARVRGDRRWLPTAGGPGWCPAGRCRRRHGNALGGGVPVERQHRGEVGQPHAVVTPGVTASGSIPRAVCGLMVPSQPASPSEATLRPV